MTKISADHIASLAQAQAERWRRSPYYDQAEAHMSRHWEHIVLPIIKDADFSNVLELACGHGRNSEYLLPLAGSLILVDVNQENVDFCRGRFTNRDSKIRYLVNNGATLKGVADGEVSFVYCYDSMVHFHSDIVRSYLREFGRVLRPGGRAFLHHSNSTNDPGGLDIKSHIQGRNFMSQALFKHYSVLEGFAIVQSTVIDWGGAQEFDCLSYIERL